MSQEREFLKPERINDILRQKQIQMLFFNFIGPDGEMYSKTVLCDMERQQFNISLIDGVGVNGQLIDEWADCAEARWLLLVPDIDTLKCCELDETYPSAFMMASFMDFPLDSRLCVKRVAEFAKELNVKPMNGIGICYKISDKNATEGNGVFQLCPTSKATALNMKISKGLQNLGIPVEYFQPMGEQHNGIELVPADFIHAMDYYSIARWYILAIAQKENLKVTFEMPKYKIQMSENPVHFSLWNPEGTENIFFDADDPMELSKRGKHFIAGILKNFKEITTIVMLSAGRIYDKKWYCTYSDERQDAAIHVPCYYKERKKHDRVGWGKRILCNVLMNGCNLHICASAVFLAGLEGVQKELAPEDYMDESLYAGRLYIDELKGNALFNQVLGQQIIDYLVKKVEMIQDDKNMSI